MGRNGPASLRQRGFLRNSLPFATLGRVADSFIRVSQADPLARLESKVRAQAARCDDVIVLAKAGGQAVRLHRLAVRFSDKPVPGRHVTLWGLPSRGALLAVTAEPLRSGTVLARNTQAPADTGADLR